MWHNLVLGTILTNQNCIQDRIKSILQAFQFFKGNGNMSMVVFWVVVLYVDTQHFGEHTASIFRLKCRYHLLSPHCITSQKANVDRQTKWFNFCTMYTFKIYHDKHFHFPVNIKDFSLQLGHRVVTSIQ